MALSILVVALGIVSKICSQRIFVLSDPGVLRIFVMYCTFSFVCPVSIITSGLRFSNGHM